MVYFSILASGTTMNAYLIDTHGSNAFHLLSLNHFAAAMISYGTTFFANGLVLSAGIRRTLLVLGALQTACWLSWIPMYVFGKRMRSFVSAPKPIRFDAFMRTHSVVACALLPGWRMADRTASPPLPQRPPGRAKLGVYVICAFVEGRTAVGVEGIGERRRGRMPRPAGVITF